MQRLLYPNHYCDKKLKVFISYRLNSSQYTGNLCFRTITQHLLHWHLHLCLYLIQRHKADQMGVGMFYHSIEQNQANVILSAVLGLGGALVFPPHGFLCAIVISPLCSCIGHTSKLVRWLVLSSRYFEGEHLAWICMVPLFF